MRVINKTHFDTAVLREVLVAVHGHMRRTRKPLACWKTLVVTVVHTRQQDSNTGYAYYHRGPVRLRIVKNCTRFALAELALHEFLHVAGYKHGTAGLHYCDSAAQTKEVGGWQDPKLSCEFLPRKEPTVRQPSPEDRAAAKLRALREREAAWLAKKRRAERALAKIKKSAKYYETKMAAFRGGKS